ncbi:hypothetical protein [Amycolatopsis sp. GM8]|uniref:hypothetical protein n=1 Tax=Amycolatopsis sp. GM8 TaxID=2896530 RepID=UPI001F2C0458|nr:hypothetical protein [Amycolatopsis sp. GM8]
MQDDDKPPGDRTPEETQQLPPQPAAPNEQPAVAGPVPPAVANEQTQQQPAQSAAANEQQPAVANEQPAAAGPVPPVAGQVPPQYPMPPPAKPNRLRRGFAIGGVALAVFVAGGAGGFAIGHATADHGGTSQHRFGAERPHGFHGHGY